MDKVIALKPMLRFIGVASKLGAPGGDIRDEALPGPDSGPQALHTMGIVAAVQRAGLEPVWGMTIEAPDGPRLTALTALLTEVADEVAAALGSGDVPIVVGGDHSIAAGTWRGVGRALGAAPGLIWIDAHLDAHTPDNSPSGNPHGMPLAALLGQGAPEMVGIDGPPLDPHRVVVIGAHSFEADEALLLKTLGVTVFDMSAIKTRGLPAIFTEALAIAGANGLPYGISLDLDAIDPLLAPGVTTPVAGGLKGGELPERENPPSDHWP